MPAPFKKKTHCVIDSDNKLQNSTVSSSVNPLWVCVFSTHCGGGSPDVAISAAVTPALPACEAIAILAPLLHLPHCLTPVIFPELCGFSNLGTFKPVLCGCLQRFFFTSSKGCFKARTWRFFGLAFAAKNHPLIENFWYKNYINLGKTADCDARGIDTDFDFSHLSP